MDINTALFADEELEYMRRLVGLVTEHSQSGIMPDSPDPEILIHCMEMSGGGRLILNSITIEDKFDRLICAAYEYGAGLVCLPMTSGRIPGSAVERVEDAKRITDKLLAKGFEPGDIYIDLLVEALISKPNAAQVALDTLEILKRELPGVKTICGLSNVSYGLPERERIHTSFLAMCISKGLDAAILDVTSTPVRQTIAAANALLGNDEVCREYIKSCREM